MSAGSDRIRDMQDAGLEIKLSAEYEQAKAEIFHELTSRVEILHTLLQKPDLGDGEWEAHVWWQWSAIIQLERRHQKCGAEETLRYNSTEDKA